MMDTVTVIIQIGNSDDKLSQREWSRFVTSTWKYLETVGDIHFSGFSPPEAVWQNACWVVEVEDHVARSIKVAMARQAFLYSQDSIAVTVGTTEFILPGDRP